jgi:serine/threonine protein kinase
MGVVFLAFDENLQLEVAVKFFKEVLPAPVIAYQSKLQSRIDFNSRSPHLGRGPGQYLDLCTHAGWLSPATVMKYHAGPSLREVIDYCRDTDSAIPGLLAGRLLRQICLAVKELHEDHKVVHRDIRPDNIILAMPSGHTFTGIPSLNLATPVVIDLSVAMDVNQVPMVALGPDAFKAPAMFATGKPIASRPARVADDVYSLGAIFDAVAPFVE